MKFYDRDKEIMETSNAFKGYKVDCNWISMENM